MITSNAEAMSQRQKDYLADLIRQRDQDPAVAEIRARLNECLAARTTITRRFASEMIYVIKTRPLNPASPAAAAFKEAEGEQDLMEALGQPKQAKGKFAVPANCFGDHEDAPYRFYNIWIHPESGNLVVKRLIGAPGDWRKEPVRGAERAKVLDLILPNAYDFQRKFGLLFKVCGRCDSPLTDPRSRAALFGEICANNMGYPYPSEEEARAILTARGEEF